MYLALRFVPLLVGGLAFVSSASADENFTTHLSDGENVPAFESPTNGQGQALFKLNGDGELSYKLIVANLPNVVASHIHCGARGVAGPVGVTLFLGAPVTTQGILAQGPILAPDTGNGCSWASTADVVDALASGDTYVNVHTAQSLPGEIRGQIR